MEPAPGCRRGPAHQTVTARLLAQFGDHRLGRVDAVHLDAAFSERERDAPGADRKLEDPPTVREVGEAVDCCLRRGVADPPADPCVVHVGPPVAVGVRSVALIRPPGPSTSAVCSCLVRFDDHHRRKPTPKPALTAWRGNPPRSTMRRTSVAF
jgi:hypothetical protein